jgi:hypothetical protein
MGIYTAEYPELFNRPAMKRKKLDNFFRRPAFFYGQTLDV